MGGSCLLESLWCFGVGPFFHRPQLRLCHMCMHMYMWCYVWTSGAATQDDDADATVVRRVQRLANSVKRSIRIEQNGGIKQFTGHTLCVDSLEVAESENPASKSRFDPRAARRRCVGKLSRRASWRAPHGKQPLAMQFDSTALLDAAAEQ